VQPVGADAPILGSSSAIHIGHSELIEHRHHLHPAARAARQHVPESRNDRDRETIETYFHASLMTRIGIALQFQDQNGWQTQGARVFLGTDPEAQACT
jgi:hypothetical protein